MIPKLSRHTLVARILGPQSSCAAPQPVARRLSDDLTHFTSPRRMDFWPASMLGRCASLEQG